MKHLAKAGLVLSLCLLTGSCDHDDDLYKGGPLSTHLNGTWILEKVVTPTRTLTGSQIGYNEKLVHMHEVDDDVEKIYRNDTLYAKHIWARNPPVITNDKKKTVLMSYRGGLKRFYKIIKESGKPDELEASDYLPEIGSVADTVKFFYTNTTPL